MASEPDIKVSQSRRQASDGRFVRNSKRTTTLPITSNLISSNCGSHLVGASGKIFRMITPSYGYQLNIQISVSRDKLHCTVVLRGLNALWGIEIYIFLKLGSERVISNIQTDVVWNRLMNFIGRAPKALILWFLLWFWWFDIPIVEQAIRRANDALISDCFEPQWKSLFTSYSDRQRILFHWWSHSRLKADEKMSYSSRWKCNICPGNEFLMSRQNTEITIFRFRREELWESWYGSTYQAYHQVQGE